jgi:hypothetical protein
VLDADGKVVVAEGEVSAVLRGHDPVPGRVDAMYQWLLNGIGQNVPVPTDPGVVANLCDVLDAWGLKEVPDRLLTEALGAKQATEEQKAGLHIVKGLRMRLAGDKTGGLAELTKGASGLTLAEGTGEGVAPFSVSAGTTACGAISSATDAVTVIRALRYAAAQKGPGVPPAGAKPEDLVGALALAAATSNKSLAAEATKGLGDGATVKDTPLFSHAAYLTAVAMALKGDPKAACDELQLVVEAFPGEPFGPDALGRIYSLAKASGDTARAEQAKKDLSDLYGKRVPARVSDQMK